MNTLNLQNLLDMQWSRFLKFMIARSLIKRLKWEQRYLKMNRRAIKALNIAAGEHSKEVINLRIQLKDMGIDPDVVAPDEDD